MYSFSVKKEQNKHNTHRVLEGGALIAPLLHNTQELLTSHPSKPEA